MFTFLGQRHSLLFCSFLLVIPIFERYLYGTGKSSLCYALKDFFQSSIEDNINHYCGGKA